MGTWVDGSLVWTGVEDDMTIHQHDFSLPAMEMSDSYWDKVMAMINNFPFEKVVQTRYVHISFGSLSCLFALIMIVQVWYESWRAQQLSGQTQVRRWAFFYNVNRAESFPLVLGFLIFVQQLTFVILQAKALDSMFIIGCKMSSQVIFTGIFALGWFHMTFGLDMTIRSLKPPTLSPRRRIWPTVICSLCGMILTGATWLSTRIRPPGDKCFGNLIFRSLKSSLLGIVLSGVMIPSFLIMAMVIGLRLNRTVLMDHNERIAGTRMVYYLVLASILYITVLPFWIQAIAGTFDPNITSSRVAEFALFASGALIAILHFFLRANAARTAIRPSTTPWMKKSRFRFFGQSDLEIINISPPIIARDEYEPENKPYPPQWTSSLYFGIPKTVDAKLALPSGLAAVDPQRPLCAHPPGTPIRSATLEDMKFPPRSASLAKSPLSPLPSFSPAADLLLPSTVYTPDKKSNAGITALAGSSTAAATALAMPAFEAPPRFSNDGQRESSATLHIGMRFSNGPAALAAARPSSANTIRFSLRSIMNHIRADTLAHKPLPKPNMQINKSPLSQSTVATQSATNLGLPTKPHHGRQRSAESLDQPSDYAWLDLEQSFGKPSPLSPRPSPLPPRPSEGLKSPRSPCSENSEQTSYLSRKESQRRLAETNRLEIANLERSGSGAGRARLRPAYPSPATPDGGNSPSLSSSKDGFF